MSSQTHQYQTLAELNISNVFEDNDNRPLIVVQDLKKKRNLKKRRDENGSLQLLSQLDYGEFRGKIFMFKGVLEGEISPLPTEDEKYLFCDSLSK